MDRCGRCAFLFRTDKQAIQCNRALTIVPNQTWGTTTPVRVAVNSREKAPGGFCASRRDQSGESTSTPMTHVTSSRREHRPPEAKCRQPNIASKCQIVRECCPKATTSKAARTVVIRQRRKSGRSNKAGASLIISNDCLLKIAKSASGARRRRTTLAHTASKCRGPPQAGAGPTHNLRNRQGRAQGPPRTGPLGDSEQAPRLALAQPRRCALRAAH
jgi:hypothetical protein